jgi:FKBP-type peptidyl-prolyl cis-trans isomerase
MKKIFERSFIVVLAMASLTMCKTKKEIEKETKPVTMITESGLEYTITQKGDGVTPQIGDEVIVHYTGKLLDSTVFDSSVERGSPFTFKLGKGQVIPGWDEAFQLLEVGDKATIKLKPELAYGSRDMGSIPANSTLIFDIELLDVKAGLREWDGTGKDTITTDSGLKIIKFESNKTGKKAEAGTRAKVHYSGFLTDGKMFDSSVERGQPFTLQIGKGQVIKGWDEGLALLRKGEKAKLIIPYELAYGEAGRAPVIPAKADLIFDVEIVDVEELAVPVVYKTEGLEIQTAASGLQYYIISKSGSGLKTKAGSVVSVHYSGYLTDGKMFDSSIERGDPIEFPLGMGRVIPGWDEGIALMEVGDKFKLVIPYKLAYGENGQPPVIPAKADLIFDVELKDVK